MVPKAQEAASALHCLACASPHRRSQKLRHAPENGRATPGSTLETTPSAGVLRKGLDEGGRGQQEMFSETHTRLDVVNLQLEQEI